MIIDFHTHVFPDKIASATISALEKASNGKATTNGTINGLIGSMKDSNIQLSVALPVITKPTQFESVNNFAINVNKQYSTGENKIISFAGIHPWCDDIPQKMEFIKEKGFVGVKIHPDYQNTFIDDERYLMILKCAKDLDLVVVTHAGVDDGFIGEPIKCPPERVLKVIDKVNHDKFVLAHFGGHKQWEDVLNILSNKNVYFDTAFTFHEIDEGLFIKIVEKHGADKILFATDCPWRPQKEDVKIFNSYKLSEDVKQQIFYKNALKLLGLKV